jgi:hypothetical protein
MCTSTLPVVGPSVRETPRSRYTARTPAAGKGGPDQDLCRAPPAHPGFSRREQLDSQADAETPGRDGPAEEAGLVDRAVPRSDRQAVVDQPGKGRVDDA